MTNVARFPITKNGRIRNDINTRSLSQCVRMPLFSKPQQNMLSLRIFASLIGDKCSLSVVLIYISLAMKEMEYAVKSLRKNPSILTFL